MNIARIIGTPALLEQTAEECSELAQACLKMARKLRGENPTPKSKAEIWESVNEEAADVQLCIESLLNSSVLSNTEINSWKSIKMKRWIDRINESGNEKEN